MIEALLPAAACSEMFSDAPESTMFPSESEIVARARGERRREFATVRYCARDALRQIGVPPVPILPDADGVPRWPVGVVGSMTHCAGYRAAVAASSRVLRSVGIDAEPDARLPAEVVDLVLREEERDHLRMLSEALQRNWGRILFCAKEAVFKTWFPLTRCWLDFLDVSVTLHPGGMFWAALVSPRKRAVGELFVGRWAVQHGLIVAVTAVGRNVDGPTNSASPGQGWRTVRDNFLGTHA